MKILEHRIEVPTLAQTVTIAPFACVHADQEGHNADLWEEYLQVVETTPLCWAIGLGDYRSLARTHYRNYLTAYRLDEDSQRDLDNLVERETREFYAKSLKRIRHKLLGLAEGNHHWTFQDGTTDTQLLCRLAGVPYLEKAAFFRLPVVLKRTGKSIHTLKMLVHHGDWSGGAMTTGGDINSMETRGRGWDADIMVAAHCFDEETEILTPTGWKRHNQLEEGQLVSTFDRKRNCLEWQPVEAIYRYDHFTEMVQVQSKLVSLCVTPDHGLWVGNKDWTPSEPPRTHALEGKWKSWRESTAAEQYGRLTGFRLAAPCDSPDLPVPDAWVRAVAWIMAEGTIAWRPSGNLNHVRIAQSDAPDGRLQQLCSDLDAAGIPYTKTQRYHAGCTEHGQHRNFDAYILTLRESHRWLGRLITLLGTNKTPTSTLYRLSARQAHIFLDTYTTADGSWNRASRFSRQIASKRRDHIDFLQALACRAGYRTSVSGGDPVYYLTMNGKNTASVRPHQWARIPYAGIAWCVSVPNGTLVVRRRGHTAITLNTHRKGGWTVPVMTVPERGALELRERPRVFIRAGCFVRGYVQGCVTYAERKLMNPTTLGWVTLRIQFAQPHNAKRYQAKRAAGIPPSKARGGCNFPVQYRFKVEV